MKRYTECYVKRLKNKIKRLEKERWEMGPILGQTTAKKCKGCGRFFPLRSTHFRMCGSEIRYVEEG